MARTDLRKEAAGGGGGGGGGVKPLDPGDPWDAVVLAEASLLQAWTGLKATLIHVTDGTAAGDGNVVCVDRAQLDGLFAPFGAGTEKYKTALFFALAHEFGHLCQFAVFGFDATFAMDSLLCEAHADYLSGVWLGMRLAQGEQRYSDDVAHAALQLKGGPPDYPTEYQRACLVQDAMGTSVARSRPRATDRRRGRLQEPVGGAEQAGRPRPPRHRPPPLARDPGAAVRFAGNEGGSASALRHLEQTVATVGDLAELVLEVECLASFDDLAEARTHAHRASPAGYVPARDRLVINSPVFDALDALTQMAVLGHEVGHAVRHRRGVSRPWGEDCSRLTSWRPVGALATRSSLTANAPRG